MSCVVCESYGVHLRPAVGVLVVPYSVSHNTRHAATKPNKYNEKNH